MTRPPIAGWKTFVRGGRRRNDAAQRQQRLAEDQRDDAADDAERRVGQQLRRMHEAIGRHVEQRLVAENRALDDDRGDRRDDRRAEQRGVHVADDLLEREQHRGHRRVEGRGQRAGGADRHEIPDPLRRQTAASGRSPRRDRRRSAPTGPRVPSNGRSRCTARR